MSTAVFVLSCGPCSFEWVNRGFVDKGAEDGEVSMGSVSAIILAAVKKRTMLKNRIVAAKKEDCELLADL